MKRFIHRRLLLGYALVFCVMGAGGRLPAQEETRWLMLEPLKSWVQMEVNDDASSESAGRSHTTSDVLYLAPTAGVDVAGAIYHPNLFKFDLKGQGGYIEEDMSANGEGNHSSSSETSYLQNYDFSGLLLQNKPYAAMFSANKEHTFQELDAFNQVTSDTQSYGGHAGYTAGPVPFGITFRHMDDTESGLNYNSTYSQYNVAIDAQNSRSNGTTTLTYNLGQYDQQTSSYTQSQFYQYGVLTDSERFWTDDRGSLNSSAFFNEQDTSTTARSVSVNEGVTLKNSQSWNSFYNYNFNNSESQATATTFHYGVAGIRNQLYQSLNSEANIHGSIENTSGDGDSSASGTYGFGNGETYTKRLSSWARLTIGNTVGYDVQSEQNSGGLDTYLNEQHVLTDGKATFLNNPLVNSVTQVTGPNGIPIYHEDIDYKVEPHGDLTQIERVPTSLVLTNGATVLVNYTVRSQPSGTFTTFTEQAQIRLDLFDGMIGLYSSAGWVENHSQEDFVLENSFSTDSGMDFSWNWLRVGGDYTTENANLISYQTLGIYQSAQFRPSTTTTLSVNAREQRSMYPQQDMSVTSYSLQSRFSERFSRAFDFSIEAGVWNESGGLVDETLYTAGLRARYTVGKLLLTMAYQFNDQENVGEMTLGNFVSFTMRREL